jgi:2-amino-4-hydroxy-6-hydroxymethyldihydropteridine diphosphokinase
VNSRPALAYVGVGSNIRPEENVVRALVSLTETPGVTLTGISTFYRTRALSDPRDSSAPLGRGLRDFDPDFLNGVLEFLTVLTPTEFLALFASIEGALGRERPGSRYAPRTMDLDLLLYGREEGSESQPIWQEIGPAGFLAHADIEGRPFVAHPLMELAPDLILPPHGTPLRAFAANYDAPGGWPQTAFTQTLRSRFLTS